MRGVESAVSERGGGEKGNDHQVSLNSGKRINNSGTLQELLFKG